jgi:hypothetical protein
MTPRSTSKLEHQEAWREATQPAFDLLSQFQYDAWAALRREFPGVELVTSGKTEPFLTGNIPGTAVQIFIYLDQAEINAGEFLFSAEHYDFDSPPELINSFIAAAKQACAA